MIVSSAVLLVILTLHRCVASILLHEAGQVYSVALAVLLGEVLKLALSISIGTHQYIKEEITEKGGPLDHSDIGVTSRWLEGLKWFKEEVKSQDWMATFVPAALYVIQNNLYLFSSSRLAPSVFQALWQLRLIPIVIFSQLLLGKKYNKEQWCCLLVIVGGVVVLQQGQGHGKEAGEIGQALSVNATLALIALLLAAIVGSLASVLLERHFKKAQTNLWVANTQLSLFSIPAAIFLLVIENVSADSSSSSVMIFTRTFWPWVPVILQGLSGILVALATKYAGSVAGAISGVAAIALTRSVQIARGIKTNASREVYFFVGFLLVVIGVGTYTRISSQAQKRTIDVTECKTDLEKDQTGRTKSDYTILPQYDNEDYSDEVSAKLKRGMQEA